MEQNQKSSVKYIVTYKYIYDEGVYMGNYYIFNDSKESIKDVVEKMIQDGNFSINVFEVKNELTNKYNTKPLESVVSKINDILNK